MKRNLILEAEDRNGNPIHLVDTVIRLRKSLFGSSEGVIYKISSNSNEITAKDKINKRVPRASYNVRIKNREDGERG